MLAITRPCFVTANYCRHTPYLYAVNDPGTVVADSSHLWRFVTQYGHQGDEYRPPAFHRSENQVTDLQPGDFPVLLCDWFLCNGILRK